MAILLQPQTNLYCLVLKQKVLDKYFFHRDDTTGMIYLKYTLIPHRRFQRDRSGVHSFLPRSSTRSFWGCNIPQWLLETNESIKVLKPAWQFGAEHSAVAETLTEEVPTSHTVQLRESQGNY